MLSRRFLFLSFQTLPPRGLNSCHAVASFLPCYTDELLPATNASPLPSKPTTNEEHIKRPRHFHPHATGGIPPSAPRFGNPSSLLCALADTEERIGAREQVDPNPPRS